jgi:flagellar biosynthesis protein FlhA
MAALGLLARTIGSGVLDLRTWRGPSAPGGLVSQIPALLLSVATGLVVTRSVSDADMGSDILRQLGRSRIPLQVAGFGALGLCLIPGLPKLPFVLVGGLMLVASSRISPSPASAEPPGAEAALPGAVPVETPEGLAESAQVDALGLELSPDIIDLVDLSAGGDLLERVKGLRRKIAGELGVMVPLVRTRDNADLPVGTYAITVLGVEVARGQSPRGTVLAIGDAIASLPGTPTREPVFGLEARWIPAASRVEAEIAGATVVDRASVITTHMAEVVSWHASRLLDRQDVQMLTDVVRRTHPVVVEELTPAQLSLGEVQRVLRGLLEEGVPIRDLVRIFEAISLQARDTKDPDVLVESARRALGPAIVARYLSGGVLPVVTFEPLLEQRLLERMHPADGGPILALEPDLAQSVLSDITATTREVEDTGSVAVLVCAPQIRSAVRRMVAPSLPHLAVLSYGELGARTDIRSVGLVRAPAPKEVAR